ncbi:hypothetical protein FisN_17Hh222 [Fistulifera solaris]|uniref:Peptidylprolyl isomerase n=1 Tax=Fistulifera solaris TaxID=1519565 RepID=A0A1Z5JHB7_FISSO|nr:hypothetical protein FisN_17Hh222 [Fistulifera solaris]|eukprot:GAX13282.1 hypothetical protein FisN_17Hh222 [Fistulifera solaris]
MWSLFACLAALCLTCREVTCFLSLHPRPKNPTSLFTNINNDELTDAGYWTRRDLFAAASVMLVATPANALVKGNAPPPKISVTDKPKCTNVEECQAAAEKREQAERELAAASEVSYKITPSGIKYIDIKEGNGDLVADGDEVELFYKVLKLGKRSYDGISGEGTVVFSRGYGLEDDESKPGVKTFVTIVGGYNNIRALNNALIGMRESGVRRIAVFPQDGWRKPGRECDGGPGGSGKGGELKTDYVLVPTATMVAAEACFDSTKQPFPTSYAEQRRMAQRFDQSLIMEIEVLRIRKTKENVDAMESPGL